MPVSDSNTKTKTVNILTVVRQADPDYYRDKRRQLEYEMSNGRKFVANPSNRHPYN